MNRVYMDHNIHFAAAVIAVRRIEIILIIVDVGDYRCVRGKWEIFNCSIPLKVFKFNYIVKVSNRYSFGLLIFCPYASNL